jgi:hypothetical protein
MDPLGLHISPGRPAAQGNVQNQFVRADKNMVQPSIAWFSPNLTRRPVMARTVQHRLKELIWTIYTLSKANYLTRRPDRHISRPISYQGNPMAIDNPATSNPWPRPRVLDVLALIWHYYQQEGHADGGSLYEVLMAHHLEPEVLATCRERAISAADELGVQILDLISAMPEPSRHRVVDYAEAIDRDDPVSRPRHTFATRPKPLEVDSTEHLPLDAELF